MFTIKNFTDTKNVKVTEQLGAFQVVEFQRDLSVNHVTAQTAYYAAEMNVQRRQLVCNVNESNITVQAGAMQWMVGGVSATNCDLIEYPILHTLIKKGTSHELGFLEYCDCKIKEDTMYIELN